MNRVEVAWSGEGMALVGSTESGHRVTLDASEAVGGRNQGARPMELVLVALGGCTAIDVLSILAKMRETPAGFRVAVEGERAESHPQVYTRILVTYELEGSLTPERIKRAVFLSEEKYCSVSAMLGATARVETRVLLNGEEI